MYILLDDFVEQHTDKLFDCDFLKKWIKKRYSANWNHMNICHAFIFSPDGGNTTFWGDTAKRVREQMRENGFDTKKRKIKKHFFGIVYY